MTTPQESEARPRGRPAGASGNQRSRLLQTAWEALAQAPSEVLALRPVAIRAGVTTALAHYYFANREGLLTALLQERVAPRIDELIAATHARATQPVVALTLLTQRLTTLLATDTAFSRCLWLPAGRAQRDQLRAVLTELLSRAQQAGTLRTDLSAAYLSDTLLGLCMFAYLDTHDAPGAADHAAAQTLRNIALLQHGIVGAHKPRHESES